MCLCGCESNAGMPFVVSPPPDEKFCDQCKFYRESDPKIPANKNRCFNPKVCEHKVWQNNTPISKGFWQRWWASGNCMVINKFNDCPLYEYEQRFADKGA